MNAENACKMLKHYFADQELTEEHRSAVKRVLDTKGINMTPAQVECLCAEHDGINEMVAALQKKLEPLRVVRRGLSRAASVAMEA